MLLGGRQSARTLHFFVTVALVLFLLVHVAMVALSGFRSRMRGDDHRHGRRTRGAPMSKISRRAFVTTGLAAAGVAGLATAAGIAKRYGLVPPDSGGIYGPGETLTYAAQRLLTTHSLAREFPRSMISEKPFANELAPLER